MPATLTYPGVYIQEIPSGSRTITGVATAVAAFVGRASRGPVDEPVRVTSLAEFERTFGGLERTSGLGYAVRDFYLNGGNLAVVVRLGGEGAAAATIALGDAAADEGPLTLTTIGPGTWGNDHRALIRTYIAEGNFGEAFRQYRVYCDLAREHLGVPPSPRLQALIASLHESWPEDAPTQR
jgi:uncharacterized protein